MIVCFLRRDPSPRRPDDKPLLQQIRLVHVLKSRQVLGNRRAQGVESDRAAAEHLDNRQKVTVIRLVQPRLVDVEFC